MGNAPLHGEDGTTASVGGSADDAAVAAVAPQWGGDGRVSGPLNEAASSAPEQQGTVRRAPVSRRSSNSSSVTSRRRSLAATRSVALHTLDERGFGGATSPRAVDRLLADAGIRGTFVDAGSASTTQHQDGNFSQRQRRRGGAGIFGDGAQHARELATEEVPRSAVLSELDDLQDSILTLQQRVGKISRAQADMVARNSGLAYRAGEIADILGEPNKTHNHAHHGHGHSQQTRQRSSLRPGSEATRLLRREKKGLDTEHARNEHSIEALATQLQRSVEALAAKQLRLKLIHQQLDYDFCTARAMVQCMFAPARVPPGPFLERKALADLAWEPAVEEMHRVADEVRNSAEAAGRQLMAFIKKVYAIGGQAMTADDLLPVFIFVLISTKPERFETPLRIFSTLQSTMRARNHELDYYCTSLVLALIYIVQQQRDDMRDVRLFKRLRDEMDLAHARRRQQQEFDADLHTEKESKFLKPDLPSTQQPNHSLLVRRSSLGAVPRQNRDGNTNAVVLEARPRRRLSVTPGVVAESAISASRATVPTTRDNAALGDAVIAKKSRSRAFTTVDHDGTSLDNMQRILRHRSRRSMPLRRSFSLAALTASSSKGTLRGSASLQISGGNVARSSAQDSLLAQRGRAASTSPARRQLATQRGIHDNMALGAVAVEEVESSGEGESSGHSDATAESPLRESGQAVRRSLSRSQSMLAANFRRRKSLGLLRRPSLSSVLRRSSPTTSTLAVSATAPPRTHGRSPAVVAGVTVPSQDPTGSGGSSGDSVSESSDFSDSSSSVLSNQSVSVGHLSLSDPGDGSGTSSDDALEQNHNDRLSKSVEFLPLGDAMIPVEDLDEYGNSSPTHRSLVHPPDKAHV